ncbi:MAG: hypothetical protein ACFFDT_21495 [Candidatus Hodarchaeota archaeon]
MSDSKEKILNDLSLGELFSLLSSKKSIREIQKDFNASPAELLVLENEGYHTEITLRDPYNITMTKLSKNIDVSGRIKGLGLFIDSLSPETRDRLLESVLSHMGPDPSFEELLLIKLLRGDKDKHQENLSEDNCTPGELIIGLYGRQS